MPVPPFPPLFFPDFSPTLPLYDDFSLYVRVDERREMSPPALVVDIIVCKGERGTLNPIA